MPTPSIQLASGSTLSHAIRFRPGDDLTDGLQAAARLAMARSGSHSAFVLSSVGSLEYLKLRMASADRGQRDDGDRPNEFREWHERLEVVSLIGTFSKSGKHLHMSVSDARGAVFGGHFVAGRVFTTLELVLGTADGVRFEREMDGETGYRELVVTNVKQTSK